MAFVMQNIERTLANLLLAAVCAVAVPASALARDAGEAGQPQHGHPAGQLRLSGDRNAESLMQRLQQGYAKRRPGTEFRNRLRGNASAIYGLEQRTSDIAIMSRRISPFERYGTYERSWINPIEIEIATGSHESGEHAGAYAIFVHRSNPIESVTVSQLDGIFGAQRSGGWDGLKWDTSVSRGAAGNIRSWGQIGVEGALGNSEIHPYGPPILGAGSLSDFQAKVMSGGAMWSERLREYVSGTAMIEALAKDPQGIAYGSLDQTGNGVKAIAVAEDGEQPSVRPTRDAVRDRKYPLSRALYLYYTIDDENGDRFGPAPLVADFVRYVLSEEGQGIVAKHGAYNRLGRGAAAAQLSRLEETLAQGDR